MNKYLLLPITLFFLLSSAVFAQQASVTFNLNLKPQLEDSTFIPGRDYVEISGSEYPFSKRGNLLKDNSSPADSVYSITLTFTRMDLNKTFSYNYILNINGQPRKESMPRQIDILAGEHELDPFYFDAFAW